MWRALLSAIALTMLCAMALAAEPTGTWLSQSGETKVRIAPCGSEFCGTIVWVKSDANDVNNPDPSLRGRSLVGIRMIFGMKPSSDGYSGKLYNFADGTTYPGKLKIVGSHRLELSGCVRGVLQAADLDAGRVKLRPRA